MYSPFWERKRKQISEICTSLYFLKGTRHACVVFQGNVRINWTIKEKKNNQFALPRFYRRQNAHFICRLQSCALHDLCYFHGMCLSQRREIVQLVATQSIKGLTPEIECSKCFRQAFRLLHNIYPWKDHENTQFEYVDNCAMILRSPSPEIHFLSFETGYTSRVVSENKIRCRGLLLFSCMTHFV